MEQITVYHVNPRSAGVVPLDMDTADLRGEMFFDLSARTQPVECGTPPYSKGNRSQGGYSGECSNQEVVASDLVISKLHLRVRKPFGTYGRCNLCLENGVDPFSGLACTPGEYSCTCGPYFWPYQCNGGRRVGLQDLSTTFAHFATCSWDFWVYAPWSCWGFPLVKKTGGLWYSTTRGSWCGSPGADASTCKWRVESVLKVVNKSCSDEIVNSAIEEYDRSHDGCFERCPDYSPGAFRNTSKPCWIYCFFAATMGAQMLMPGGSLGGMPIADLDKIYEKPFLPVELGGCPPVEPVFRDLSRPMPPSTWRGLGSFRMGTLDHGARAPNNALAR